MEDTAYFLSLSEIPNERCKGSVTVQAAESLLGAFGEISRIIIDSSNDTVLGKNSHLVRGFEADSAGTRLPLERQS